VIEIIVLLSLASVTAPLYPECLRVINTAGLDAYVGFLHEMNPSKNSLAYDRQEPFRFLFNVAVIA